MQRQSHGKGLYAGDRAIFDYINPETAPVIPLVELPSILNEFKADGVRIFAKLMNATPLTNVKSLPAFRMLSKASERGELRSKSKIIESSSGNTVLSLGILGHHFGLTETAALVSDSVAQDKLELLRFMGITPIVNKEPMCPDKDDPESGINIAKRMGNTDEWFNAGQYDNQDNPDAHYTWTGPQIWEQTSGKVTVFASTLGTTGTMTGAGKYLKEQNNEIVTVGVASKDDKIRLGPRTKNLLTEIGFSWAKVVDRIEEVKTEESLLTSLELCRNGLFVGPSSGFNMMGLCKYISRMKRLGKLDSLRNSAGEIWAVFICCDTPFPYIREYVKTLDDSHFPQVQNAHLLRKTVQVRKQVKKERIFSSVSVTKAFQLVSNKSAFAIDVRKKSDFEKFRIENITHVSVQDIESASTQLLDSLRKERVIVFDCGLSNGASYAAALLRGYGIDAVYVKGGMDTWTKRGLPFKRYSN